MKRILFTGGTGFLGRNLVPILKERYVVDAPKRKELNLLDEEAVLKYLEKGGYDIVVHSAISNYLYNDQDKENMLCEDTIRIFMNLYKCNNLYKKMIYFGSGAEFDKTKDIVLVSEDDFGRSVPKDAYGLSKYVLNELCRKSDNIYNLRIFGCYGNTDADFKFISHVINCCLLKEPITIKQNCYFDYLQVTDLAKMIEKIIENEPKYKDYNACTGKRFSLYDIANMVRRELNYFGEIVIETPGLNKEYTGNNARIINEFSDLELISLNDGIKMQIAYEKERLGL